MNDQKGTAMANDPVCGMIVDKTTEIKSERAGRTYHFCSLGCHDEPTESGRSSKLHDVGPIDPIKAILIESK